MAAEVLLCKVARFASNCGIPVLVGAVTGVRCILAPHSLGDLIILDSIVAGDLNVDGRWQTEVQNLAGYVSRLEKEGHSREHDCQALSKVSRILQRRTMLGVQRDQDFTVAI